MIAFTNALLCSLASQLTELSIPKAAAPAHAMPTQGTSLWQPELKFCANRPPNTDLNMAPCYVCRFLIFILSLQVPMAVRASRLLDLAPDVELGSSLRLRSLQDRQDDSVVEAKLSHKDQHSETNWKEFSEKLLARQMGSKPPNCDGKCDLCRPCNPVEVPISNKAVQKVSEDEQHSNTKAAQPDDTNYMPESWRCACGNAYYNP